MRLTLTARVCPLPSFMEMLRSKRTVHTWIQLFKLKYRDKMFQGLASSRKKSCDSPNGASFRHTRTGDLFTPLVSPEWIPSGRNSLTALVSQPNSFNYCLWVIRSAWFTFRFYFLILVFTTNLCILRDYVVREAWTQQPPRSLPQFHQYFVSATFVRTVSVAQAFYLFYPFL